MNKRQFGALFNPSPSDRLPYSGLCIRAGAFTWINYGFRLRHTDFQLKEHRCRALMGANPLARCPSSPAHRLVSRFLRMVMPGSPCQFPTNGSAMRLATSAKPLRMPVPLHGRSGPTDRHLTIAPGMNIVQSPPTADTGCSQAYEPRGLAVLLREAAAGNDLMPLGQRLLEHAQRYDDPYALLDLSFVLQLKYERASALAVQALAIKMRRHYRLKNARSAQPAVKVLALKAPGDLMVNTPFECLLESADLQLDVLYVDCNPLNDERLPEHDVVFVAACASDDNAAFLSQMAALTSRTRSRVLNRPERVAKTTRDAAYALLGQVPGICMAHTIRMSRERILAAAAGAFELSSVLNGQYPFIVPPVAPHPRKGLLKVSTRHQLSRSS